MPKRFVSIWFRYLLTDWKVFREPSLRGLPVAFTQPDHGRMLICASNSIAEQFGLRAGMTAADAKVIAPGLRLFEEKPGHNLRLLRHFAEWFLRYTPLVMLDPPDGLLLDVTGCTHLKGDETAYVLDIVSRLNEMGYTVRAGMADTIGCAWAVTRCAQTGLIVSPGGQRSAIASLPPVALRLSSDLLLKLDQLGFYTVSDFIHMPRSVLRRRFGNSIVLRLYQALGQEPEFLLPLAEHVLQDYATTGLSIKAHPLSFLRPNLQKLRTWTTTQVKNAKPGQYVRLAGIMLFCQRPGTAKGVCFITLEDEESTCNLVVFKQQFHRFRKEILSSDLLCAEGRIQKEGEVTHLIVTKCYDYSRLLALLSPIAAGRARQLKNSPAAKKIDPYAEAYFDDTPAEPEKRPFPKSRNFK